MKLNRHVFASSLITVLLMSGARPPSEALAESAAATTPAAGKLSLMTLMPLLTPVSKYDGDLWTRNVLLGDPGGERRDFYEKGIALDFGLTQLAQGIASGGRNNEWEYSGMIDYYLSIDSGRQDLWPGGLLQIRGRTKYGRSVNPDAGVLMPVNFGYLYPSAGEQSETFLEEYTITQGLTDWLAFFAGRAFVGNTGDLNRFANDEKTQFLNTALRNSPLLGVLTSSLSAHILALQAQPVDFLQLSLFSLSRNDKDGVYGSPGGLFSEYSIGAQALVTWELADLPGEALPIAGYSSKNVVDLDNPFLPRRIALDRILGIAIPQKNDNWVTGFSADQYFYMPKGAKQKKVGTASFDKEPEGLGVFLRFHYAPDDRNPWNIFASGGLGGRGVIPTRSLDRYGLGFYSLIASDKLENQRVLGRRVKLGTEWGLEAFYNIAITPWLQLTPDLQYVQSGLPGIDDALILGTRLQMNF